jgi:hypothetical protein
MVVFGHIARDISRSVQPGAFVWIWEAVCY